MPRWVRERERVRQCIGRATEFEFEDAVDGDVLVLAWKEGRERKKWRERATTIRACNRN